MVRGHLGTKGTLARENVSTQSTLAREHVNMQGTLAHEHVSKQGTLAREHVSKKGTLARQHVFSMQRTHFSRLSNLCNSVIFICKTIKFNHFWIVVLYCYV